MGTSEVFDYSGIALVIRIGALTDRYQDKHA